MKRYDGISSLARGYALHKQITMKEAEERIKDVLFIMERSLLDTESDGIQILDFITLQKVHRKAKLGRNPLTKVEYHIPEKISVKAILGKKFDKDLNK